MRVIGFNTTRIHAFKETELTKSAINTDIIFTEIEREKLEILKDTEAIKASFRFAIMFKDSEKKIEKKNEVSFEGSILLAVDKEESKEFLKAWKKREVPKDKVLPLYNFILKKCSVKALQLEEDINLPAHIPFPQIRNMPSKQ